MVAVVQKRTCRVRLQSKGFDRVFSIEKNLELFDEIGHTIKKISSLLPGIWPPDLIEADDKNVRIGLIGIPKVGDGFRSIENHVYPESCTYARFRYLFTIDKNK
ncbi:hypothetical protein BIY37_01365 [Candidatus Brocadia sapporoensis]|uniref:Uncharacterized protein n=1 Tax=Candidatus Brocadia sapporoensis TaxID=392547 RepID=A0A1V6M338_9BACT|nr:hypothetical protein [Candidatus Brocadia sapporoensis]OQD46821.1 hypothetical protein BIY37_01365 [Candidatus Brocadia sapporoensis]GJQ23820.1 MAG: hypothetical protein HBSAPP01_16100 [Candidatus Brocadia sapporoensis]